MSASEADAVDKAARVRTALETNAFPTLGATPRDSRARLVELADEAALSGDLGSINKARGDLINPRTRLAAEIAWLPGLAPRRAESLLRQIHGNRDTVLADRGLPDLARANALAAIIETLGEHDAGWLESLIRELAALTERIDAEVVLRDINEDRAVAQIVAVVGVEAVEAELAERRRHYRTVITSALDRLDPAALVHVMTVVVEEATVEGEAQAHALIDELVDAYETEARGFLEREAGNAKALIDAAKNAAPRGAEATQALVERVEAVVRNWVRVARPIQLSQRARGMDHAESRTLAYAVRGLAITLFNEHDLMDAASRLTALLREQFKDVVEVAERVNQDAATLSDLQASKRVQDRLAPLAKTCSAVFSRVENNPTSGADEGRALLASAQGELISLEQSGPAEAAARARNLVVGTVLQCAVAYGNRTENWSDCVLLLERIAALVSEDELRERINKALEVARANQRLMGGLKSIKSAPSLYTLNGIGVTLYGQEDADPQSGSYMATYYFVFLFIPVFPLCRYRVIPTTGGYRFLGKGPLRPFDWAHLAMSAALLLWMFTR